MHEASDSSDLAQSAVRMHWGVEIPLRDSIRLSGILYLPKGQQVPAPAILTLTPYVAQSYHDRGMYFAAHGHPFLAVDVRGRGNSAGTFCPFVKEDQDAVDVIEWLARQPYCNGQVGMWGGSYSACVQWGAAKHCPRPLATIVPVASVFSWVDYPMRNNIARPYWIRWLTLVSGRTSQEKIFLNNERYWAALYREWFEAGLAFKDLETHLGIPSLTFKEWVAHPQRDAYWEGYNPADEEFAKIDIPVLTITGVYDSAQLGALEHYRRHLANCAPEVRAQHYLVIGPWDHAGTRTPTLEFGGLKIGAAGLLDLGQLHLEWYAWTMQRGPKPAFLHKNVAYYVMVADEWHYANTLEAVTARSVPLYLHSSGNPTDVFSAGSLIAEAQRESGPDQYVYDPRDVSLAALESMTDSEAWADHRMVYASAGKQLVYHSAAFDRDTDICGFFRFTAWLAIDQPDTDFRVSIYDAGLDGSAIQLAAESLRARYRQSLSEGILIHTREPLRYEFDHFTFVSRRIRKGHRLRLIIDPPNSIYTQKNYNSGGVVAEESMQDARTVTVRVFHDLQHPSALHVPLAHGDGTS